jgi:hypothetical protein
MVSARARTLVEAAWFRPPLHGFVERAQGKQPAWNSPVLGNRNVHRRKKSAKLAGEKSRDGICKDGIGKDGICKSWPCT